MESSEFNKLAMAGLTAATCALALTIVAGEIFHIEKPEKQAYVIEGVVEEASAAPAPAEAEKPIGFYLASATAAQGEAVFKKCAACHNVEKGGPGGIGPNLYGIVGDDHAHIAGFGYSASIAAMKGKPWTWDELNAWLKNPKAYAPGNKMSFAGISKPQDRAALLLYLNSKDDAPEPVPAAPAETVTAEAAPAEAAGAPAQAAGASLEAPAAAVPTT